MSGTAASWRPPAWRDVPKPALGMLHLPALPGAPQSALSLAEIERAVLRDAAALVDGGLHGLMLENFGDVPFYPGRVPARTVAQLTALACAVKRAHPGVPLGVNALRNDGVAALAAAHAAGAEFIRVNVLSGARVADQGLLQGIAHDLLRERAALGAAAAVRILADVNVKHSAPLGPLALEAETADLIERALADGVVVSGRGTGQAVVLEELRRVKAAAGACPVWLGSGVSAENVSQLAPHADGFIVGTSLKVDGVSANPVDPARVRAFVRALSRA